MATRTSSPTGSRSNEHVWIGLVPDQRLEHPIPERQEADLPSQPVPHLDDERTLDGEEAGRARKPVATKTAAKRPTGGSKVATRRPAARPAPRAVRTGTGPVAGFFLLIFRGLAAVWLALAHAIGAGARGLGRTARELEPEHRRDGAGLFLLGGAVVVAAAVWFEATGGVMEFARAAVVGTVGKVGWLVPLALVWSAWRLLRDPVGNGPAGRQAIGWVAFTLGLLGVVHLAAGNPEPVSGDTTPLRDGGGAVGYVVSSLLLDLLRSTGVVIPVLLLIAVFGVLVITATPLYRVPDKLAALRDAALGRPDDASATRSADSDDWDIDPDLGDPAYDSPVLEDTATRKRRSRAARRRRRRRHRGDGGDRADATRDALDVALAHDEEAEEDAGVDVDLDAPFAPPPRGRPDVARDAAARDSSPRRTRRSSRAWSSSRSPATSSTRCRPTRCSSPARSTRPARRPATRWSTG